MLTKNSFIHICSLIPIYMKRSFFLCMCSMLFYFNTSAQVTITKEDLLAPTTLTQFSQSGSMFPIPEKGADKFWDYSAVVADDTIEANFKEAFSSPYFYEFPSASLVLSYKEDRSSHFYKTGANGLYHFASTYFGDSSIFKYEQPHLILPAPITYGQTIIDSTRKIEYYKYQDPNKPPFRRYITSSKDVYEAIGYGSVKTPAGTYDNALLVCVTSEHNDTSSYSNHQFPTDIRKYTTVFYTWLIKDSSFPFVLTLAKSLVDTNTTDVTYFAKKIATSMPGTRNENFFQYPVPADKQFFIELKKGIEGMLTVYDINGQIKFRQSVNNATNKVFVETESLPEGMYFYEIKSSSGSVVKNKITVAH